MTKNKAVIGRRQFYLPGLFFISGAALGLQISITRLLAVSIGQSFTYLAISLALLGYGAAALLLQVTGQNEPARQQLLLYGTLSFALFIPTAFYLAGLLACDPWQIVWDKSQLTCFLLLLFCLFLPFFFAGLAVAACYLEKTSRLGFFYAADLGGAAAGCLLALFLFSRGWDERILWVLAACAVAALLFFCLALARQRFLPALAAAILLLLAWAVPLQLPVSPHSDLMLALDHEGARLEKTSWDSSGRLDLVQSPAVRFAPGLSLAYTRPLPDQTGLTVDGGQLQALTALEADRMDFLAALPSALPYHLARPENVFIYGFGGGQDILAAFFHGAAHVRASEANQGIVTAWQEFYAGSADVQDWLDTGRLQILPQDGRRLLQKDDQLYDLIVLPLVTSGPAGQGLFLSGEDYSFTREALAGCYAALAEGGCLTVSRYLEPFPAEALRLPLTIIEVWSEKTDPKASLVAIRSWSTYTILAKKGTFSTLELAGLREFCDKNSFDLVYCPGIEEAQANRYNRFSEPVYYQLWQSLLDESGKRQLQAAYLFNITPAIDDAPFYHNYFSWDRLGRILKSSSGNWRFLIQGGFLLPLILAGVLVLALIFLVLPLLVRRKKQKKISRASFLLLPYFFWIGIGFIFFESSLISRLAVLFDNPAQAMAVVLSSLLLFTGLGSLGLDRQLLQLRRPLAFLVFIPAVLLLAYAGLLPGLVRWLMPLTDFWRWVLAGLSLLPAGLSLGLPYVLGLAFCRQKDEAALPWALALNSFASVIGAPLALLFAAGYGHGRTTALAAGSYLLAGLFLLFALYSRAFPVMGTKDTSAS